MVDLIDAPSVEAFWDHEGSSFSVEGDAGAELELTTVDATADVVDGWRRFTVVFRGDEGLESGIYRLSSDGLDPFDVTLSPNPSMSMRPDAQSGTGSVEYEAVFARRDPGRVALADGGGNATADDDVAVASDAVGMGIESFIGSIGLFAGGFAPKGYMYCNGQTVPISQQEALFSILGTAYGGDGQTSFDLPDLRGRVPIGTGAGPGLSNHVRGEFAGKESVPLTTENLAPHAHGADQDLPVGTSTGNATSPDGNALAAQPRGADEPIYTTEGTDGSMAIAGDTDQTGGGQPVENMPPYLVVAYVICANGIYPERS